MTRTLPRGPVMLGVEGLELTAADRERLAHPLVGGVILFARNFESAAQLARADGADPRAARSRARDRRRSRGRARAALSRRLHRARRRCERSGELWDRDVAAAAREATRIGTTIGSELRRHGVDLAFTPVLDLDYGASTVIGDRAFHRNPERGCASGGRVARGSRRRAAWRRAASTFPVTATSPPTRTPTFRSTIARSRRSPPTTWCRSARWRELGLESMMAAHVVYPAVDSVPAGYSHVWCTRILRERLGFDGLLFSDDLGMAGRVHRRRHRRARRCRARRGLRRRAHLQRDGRGRRAARALEACAAAASSRVAGSWSKGARLAREQVARTTLVFRRCFRRAPTGRPEASRLTLSR